MNIFSKLGLAAALTFSAITLAPPVFAGNPHWGEEQLDRSRATALRARCMDANGHCIESLMLGVRRPGHVLLTLHPAAVGRVIAEH